MSDVNLHATGCTCDICLAGKSYVCDKQYTGCCENTGSCKPAVGKVCRDPSEKMSCDPILEKALNEAKTSEVEAEIRLAHKYGFAHGCSCGTCSALRKDAKAKEVFEKANARGPIFQSRSGESKDPYRVFHPGNTEKVQVVEGKSPDFISDMDSDMQQAMYQFNSLINEVYLLAARAERSPSRTQGIGFIDRRKEAIIAGLQDCRALYIDLAMSGGIK